MAARGKLLLSIMVLGGLLLSAPRAQAAGDDKYIVLLDIEGEKSPRLKSTIGRMIKKHHKVMVGQNYRDAARRQRAEKLIPVNVKKICAYLNADGVIDGTVVQENGRYKFTLRLRSGATGAITKKIPMLINQPSLSENMAMQLEEKLLAAIDDLPRLSGGGDDEDAAPAKGGMTKGKGKGQGKKAAPVREDEDDDDEADDEEEDDDEDEDFDDEGGSAKARKAKAAKLKAEKEKAAKLKAEKEKADKAAKLKAEKEKAAKLKAEKEKADKARADKAKADKARRTAKKGGDEDEDFDEDEDEADDADEDDEGDASDEEAPPARTAKPAKGKRVAMKDAGEEQEVDAEDVESDDEDSESEEDESEEESDDPVAGEIDGGVDTRPRSSIAPRHTPLLVYGGVSFIGRTLAFNHAGDAMDAPPGYQGKAVPGIAASGALYPLAFGGKRGLTSNIGVGFSIDRAVGLKSAVDDGMGGLATIATKSQRFGVGLRYRHNFGDNPDGLSIEAGVGYNKMTFNLSKDQAPEGVTVDVPNVDYTYVDPGLGARIPIITNLSALVEAKFLLVTNTGPIQNPQQYGAATVTGFDGDGGLEYRIGKHFLARAGVRYIMIGYKFKGTGTQTDRNMDGTTDVGGASDKYFGGYLLGGYVF